jgi:hypothetical protein
MDSMRTNGLVDSTAEALAQREDDHSRWSDDGGTSPNLVRQDTLSEAPSALPVALTRTGCPDRSVFRRRPAA